MPYLSRPPGARSGLRKLIGAAVLSPIRPTVVGVFPVAALARSISVGSELAACVSAVGDDWKIYLKPRLVSESAYDKVSQGICARSVTSVIASVKVESHAPRPPTTSGCSATRRCAAFLA